MRDRFLQRLPHDTLAITLAIAALTSACTEPPQTTPAPAPSFERCDPIKTERECFEAGCSFFANGSIIQGFGGDECTRSTSFGVCLFSKDPEGDDTLTTYTRVEDGATHSVQLGFDVALEGWTRCGNLAIPPDCDCSGD